MEDIILYFSYFNNGDWNKIYQSILNKEKVDYSKLHQIKQKLGCNYLTILSKDYPSDLKQVTKPPFVLYYLGDLSLISAKLKIAVVGTRKPSSFGLEVTNDIVKDLVKGEGCIVSGLAYGIDSRAHKTALSERGKTIAVIGNGFNHYYPLSNKSLQDEIIKKGLLISEYPPHVPPRRDHFPLRNRIIAALSDFIIVTEAKLRSGTLITVNYGLDLGKDIWCVPSVDLGSSACNYLIKQGANLLESANDILNSENN